MLGLGLCKWHWLCQLVSCPFCSQRCERETGWQEEKGPALPVLLLLPASLPGWGSWFCSPPPSLGTPRSTIRRAPLPHPLRSESQICGTSFLSSWGSFITTSSSLVASTHIRMTHGSIFPSHTSLQYYVCNRHPIVTLNLWCESDPHFLFS